MNDNENAPGLNWVNSSRFVGWLARIYYPERTLTKGFSRSIYGSKAKARAAAIQWMEAQIAKEPPPKKKPYRIKPIKTNTSGYNGICFTHKTERNGKRFEVIAVSYCPTPNEHRTKTFRIHLYGSFEEALEEALKFRAEQEQEADKIRKRNGLWPYERNRLANQPPSGPS